MELTEVTDDQLASWKENSDGSGQVIFKFRVDFVKLHGKFTRELLYHGARYKITWISVDRKLLTFQRIETPETKEPKRRRKPKKDAKPKKPERFQLEPETYESHDHFGSREAGEAAVLENTPPPYKKMFHEKFEEIHGYLVPCPGITSQHVTGRIGMPPKGNSVPALMNACVRRHRKDGLDKIVTIKSPYDMRKLAEDERHEHELRIWGYPEQKKLYTSDPEGWLSGFWSWWNKYFPPNLENG